MSGMTLGVYVRGADGRVVVLRPPHRVRPVDVPDIHAGPRYPPCRCPRHLGRDGEPGQPWTPR